jgi:hypothetical protein
MACRTWKEFPAVGGAISGAFEQGATAQPMAWNAANAAQEQVLAEFDRSVSPLRN